MTALWGFGIKVIHAAEMESDLQDQLIKLFLWMCEVYKFPRKDQRPQGKKEGRVPWFNLDVKTVDLRARGMKNLIQAFVGQGVTFCMSWVTFSIWGFMAQLAVGSCFECWVL